MNAAYGPHGHEKDRRFHGASAVPLPPLVSVIIPSVRPDRVRDALQSVREQTWGGPYEVVVFFDGVSGAALQDLAAPLPVTVVESSVRLGPAGARNRAVAAARGEVLAFLDDDDVWLPQHLQETVPPTLASGGIVFTDVLVEHVDEGWERALVIPFHPELLRRTNPVVLSSLVMTKRAFTALRGFSEDLPRYEDWDLLLRSAALALPLTRVPGVSVRYRFSHRSASADRPAMAEVFAQFTARHGLGNLPVTNFARMAIDGLPEARGRSGAGTSR